MAAAGSMGIPTCQRDHSAPENHFIRGQGTKKQLMTRKYDNKASQRISEGLFMYGQKCDIKHTSENLHEIDIFMIDLCIVFSKIKCYDNINENVTQII